MGGKKNTSLDGEACKIGDMDVKKGTKDAPLHVQCFRCGTKKTSLVLAKWTTSDGAKELCQGCAGLVHQRPQGRPQACTHRSQPRNSSHAPLLYRALL